MRALTQYKLAGTGSFRLSAAQLFEYGLNLQNTDKAVIDIFEALAGWKIVQVDQAGAEALVVAYLAGPGKYRELFTEGVKPHIYVALHLFVDKFRGDHPRDRYWLKRPAELKALPEWKALSDRIKKSDFEYDIGKRTGHASNYKMGPYTFRQSTLKESEGSLNLSDEQSRYFLGVYKELFPEVVEEQNEVEARMRRDRLLRNLFGYPRRFDRKFTDGYIREGISWIPQSTVGCITHRAFTELCGTIVARRLSWRPCSNKHDSYAALVPEAEALDAARLMTGLMAQTMVGWDGTEFTMRSEAQIGDNWGKWHETKNPNGMKEVKV